MQLRPYQNEAIEIAKAWLSKTTESAVIEAATGAGKSLIVANIAKWLKEKSGKNVLCLAPSKELTEQNHQKFLAYGENASIYSASIGKSLRHPVVFGTPVSVLNAIKAFKKADFSAVIVDECHGITPTIIKIIDELKKQNPKLRVLGLSATPYRLKTGYIYAYDENGKNVPEDETEEPYFHSLIYRITAPELIAMGYLTPPNCDPVGALHYDTSAIKTHSEKEYEETFEGKGRLTSDIIADIVYKAKGRRGVMIFAATIAHAKECLESLPKGSRLITGDMNKSEREQALIDFKLQRFKYIVNVGTLTTGFDAPHVDVIAVLRATESAGLFEQIIGRGMRLYDDKQDFLLLDYAENIERHGLENNLFQPKIKAKKKKEASEPIDVFCPLCRFVNAFSARPNPDRLNINSDGNFCDLFGSPIMIDENTPLPAHFGRRCFGYSINGMGQSVRCEHRFAFKPCPECAHENDIAARYCEKCKTELVDPNEKLQQEHKRVRHDPHSINTEIVTWFNIEKWRSSAGNETIKATYQTEYRKFYMWYMPATSNARSRRKFEIFSEILYGRIIDDLEEFISLKSQMKAPQTITYSKQRNNDFYEIYEYNRAII